MFLKLFIVVLVLIAFVFVALGFNIIFRKKPFPNTEIGANKYLRSKGIKCTRCNEIAEFKKRKRYTKLSLDIKAVTPNA